MYPPVKEFTLEGVPITPKAICYVDDYIKGFAVLTAYKAGTYTPGMELDLKIDKSSSDKAIQAILADYSRYRGVQVAEESKPTFAQVYEDFYKWKYEGKKEYSDSAKAGTRAGYKNSAILHDEIYADITYQQMQDVIDKCPLKHASLEKILTLFKEMAKYARANKIIDSLNEIELLRINVPDDDEQGVPLTDEEVALLWKNKDVPFVDTILILCYSGFRINEIGKSPIENIHLNEKYFQCGLKNDYSKKRIVPIHSAILPLVENRKNRNPKSLIYYDMESDKGISSVTYRKRLAEAFALIGIDSSHTPHDCRHTFSRLCKKYKVEDDYRRKMMGHAFNDVSNRVYGHWSLEDLRTEIEKIKICC